MAFILSNPYATYSGRQRLYSGAGEFGMQGDPSSWLENFIETGSADLSGTPMTRVKSEFAPYVSQDDYGYMADFDAIRGLYDQKVAADRARYNTLEAWDDPSLRMAGSVPNYVGALARGLGMTPQQFQDWSVSQGASWQTGPTWGSDVGVGSWGGNTNPFVNQTIALDTLINNKGLAGNADVMAWRRGLDPALSGGGEDWVRRTSDEDMTGWSGIRNILQGAMFAMTPLTLGAALTGIPAATAAGGGLGGAVLGAIANPAQAMGVSGPLGSLVNTGIKQGLSSLMENVSNPGERLSSSPSFSSRQSTPETPSISETVTGPTTSQTSSLSEAVTQPESLSSAVVSYSKPKRPTMIRLSEGFRRGAY